MTTKLSVGSGEKNAVGMTDDEKLEAAIAAELAERVETYGGLHAYSRDFGVDRRNMDKYLKNVRTPTLPQLLKHLSNLKVAPGDFFDSVNERVELGE